MRITGGQFRGRRLRTPPGDAVRPTQDRVREALFNRLAGRLVGARFVDLFAGTGSVGIEALSRGAASVLWVERHRRTWQVLRENVTALNGSEQDMICADVFRWLAGPGGATGADFVFADPPYCRQDDSLRLLLDALRAPGRMAPNGLLILERGANTTAPSALGWTETDARRYGQTTLIFYQQEPITCKTRPSIPEPLTP